MNFCIIGVGVGDSLALQYVVILVILHVARAQLRSQTWLRFGIIFFFVCAENVLQFLDRLFILFRVEKI